MEVLLYRVRDSNTEIITVLFQEKLQQPGFIGLELGVRNAQLSFMMVRVVGFFLPSQMALGTFWKFILEWKHRLKVCHFVSELPFKATLLLL